jgi:2-methylcitrate dehydratase PrpD
MPPSAALVKSGRRIAPGRPGGVVSTRTPHGLILAVVGVDLLERARALLVDYLVVEARGARSGAARAARAALLEPGPVTVDGTEERATPQSAALLNGVAAHAIELDDTYEPASVHPGVVVWPAVLAVAEPAGADLGAVLRAGAAGYDTACRIGDRLDPHETYRRGFHPTGVVGPLAAASAVAALLGLDDEQTAAARAIATSAAAGLLAFLHDGASTKPLHAGQAAAAGLRAAQLARAGFRAPSDAIDGPNGLLHAFGRRSGAVAERPAGSGITLTSTKPFPCCRYAHPGIDALLSLRGQHRLEPGEVEEIRCAVLGAGAGLIADPPEEKLRIRDQVDAQFSMPFLAALALREGRVTLEDLEQAPALASGLEPLMRRVRCTRSDELEAAYPQAWGAEVTVLLRDGRTLRHDVRAAPGSPDRPQDEAELRAKADGLLGPAGIALAERWLGAPTKAVVAELRAPG